MAGFFSAENSGEGNAMPTMMPVIVGRNGDAVVVDSSGDSDGPRRQDETTTTTEQQSGVDLQGETPGMRSITAQSLQHYIPQQGPLTPPDHVIFDLTAERDGISPIYPDDAMAAHQQQMEYDMHIAMQMAQNVEIGFSGFPEVEYLPGEGPTAAGDVETVVGAVAGAAKDAIGGVVGATVNVGSHVLRGVAAKNAGREPCPAEICSRYSVFPETVY